MTSVEVVLDHYLWKKKIKNPKFYIKKKIEKLSKLNLFKNLYFFGNALQIF